MGPVYRLTIYARGGRHHAEEERGCVRIVNNDDVPGDAVWSDGGTFSSKNICVQFDSPAESAPRTKWSFALNAVIFVRTNRRRDRMVPSTTIPYARSLNGLSVIRGQHIGTRTSRRAGHHMRWTSPRRKAYPRSLCRQRKITTNNLQLYTNHIYIVYNSALAPKIFMCKTPIYAVPHQQNANSTTKFKCTHLCTFVLCTRIC